MNKPKKSCLEVGVVLLAKAGTWLPDVLIEAVKLVQRMKRNRRVLLIFNERTVEVTKTSTPEELYNEWNRKK